MGGIQLLGKQAKSNEWYTQEVYLAAAREVFKGPIELDPASSPLANTLVQAERYYTIEDNGLALPWRAKTVWLNPPFGKIGNLSLIKEFTNKLVKEHKAGNVEEAVLLSTCDCDASWFRQLWEFLICFTYDNVYFYKPVDGCIKKETRHGHLLGTIFVYLGPDRQRFTEVFSQFGAVR